MRPALVRLLKRQSTLSIIETLVTTPIGLDQLGPQYTSVRCHSQRPKRREAVNDLSYSPRRETISKPPTGTSNKKAPELSLHTVEQKCEPGSECQQTSTESHHLQTDDPVEFLRVNPQRLDFESDLGHDQTAGARLVDNPEHKNNFKLWEELLRYRQHQYGESGTQTIWEGMISRLGDDRLPVARDNADFLWQKFVDLGLKRVVFLDEIMRYAIDLWKNEGRNWPNLYESVVGGLFDQGSATRAIYWHRELQRSGIAVPSDIIKVLDKAISPACLAMYQALPGQGSQLRESQHRRKILKALCERSTGGLYRPLISKLLEYGFGMDALAMHSFLVKRDDHPATIHEIQRLMTYLSKYGISKDFEFLTPEYESLQAYFKELFDPNLSEGEQWENIEQSAPKNMFPKDDLGARLFATRALSFDMVLGAFKIMGVSVIGPRALREMALKHHEPHDLRNRLKAIEEANISIGDCVFSRLIQKFAAQNRGILLSSLLETDQHPDALEDEQLQETLLMSYYMAPDRDLYNLSLAILEEHYPHEPELWNIHFRRFITVGDLKSAFRVVDEMALRSKTLTDKSVYLMTEKVMKPRTMQRRPADSPGLSTPKQMRFMFQIFKRMVPTGCHVHDKVWVEMLRRLGMTRNWRDLRECCLWLVRHYGDRGSKRRNHKSLAKSQQLLATVFHYHMQAAIISWGFQSQINLNAPIEGQYYEHPSSGERLIPFVCGISLIRELEQAGLPIDHEKVRYATRVRLQQLYGHYRPSRKRVNRTVRRTNPFTLRQVLKDIDCAWGEPFWAEEATDSLALEELVNPKRQPLPQNPSHFDEHIPRSMCVGHLSDKRAAR